MMMMMTMMMMLLKAMRTNLKILLSEVSSAIHHLKSNKSPGPDEVPAELIKNIANKSGATVIRRLCKKTWKTKTWPVEWKNLAFLTLLKKGDVSV